MNKQKILSSQFDSDVINSLDMIQKQIHRLREIYGKDFLDDFSRSYYKISSKILTKQYPSIWGPNAESEEDSSNPYDV